MSRRDTTIDPRILESAKHEFLEKGYEEASLKTICEHAAVTTGALYKRYKGKDDLFHAVVQPTLDELTAIANQRRANDFTMISDQELIKAWDMDEAAMLWWFELLYQHYDGFILLLRCSQGSQYANFHHDWVEMMTQFTYEYYMEALRRGLSRTKLSKKEMHALLSGFWATIYEPFIHGFTWEEIVHHSNMICKLFNWSTLLYLN